MRTLRLSLLISQLLPCLVLCVERLSSGATAHTARRLATDLARLDDDEEPWKPPPEYGLRTMGHKTMYLAGATISGQNFRLLIDSGSSLLVVPGSTCKSKACSAHAKLDTTKCADKQTPLSISYGLGSVRGRLFSCSVCLPGTSENLQEIGGMTFLQVARKVGHRSHLRGGSAQEGDFCADVSVLAAEETSDDLANEPFDGILGLGLDDPALQGKDGYSVLQQLRQANKIGSTAFTLHLGNSGDSQLLVGDPDESAVVGGQYLWVPLSPFANGYWQFTVMDLTLNGESQGFAAFDVNVDSGTSLLAASDDLKSWLIQKLQPSNCGTVDQLPKLGLRVKGGGILSLLPSDFVDRTGGECKLALMPGDWKPVNGQKLILGDSFLRRYTTVFDREGQRLGFGAAASDELAGQVSAAMFPAPVTTKAPTTTEGPPPPQHMEYETFATMTTTQPPTAAELAARQQQDDLNAAFGGLGADLEKSFDKAVAKEHGMVQPPSNTNSGSGQQDAEQPSEKHTAGLLADGSAVKTEASGDYMSYLSLVQMPS
eukprot:TRINITY_DN30995_c0_g1_i1.p1 TRINITY_DN30995_c0_g1~~TRINITY_DN30995_c0_g1_i1.p1  ORF type:complete len:542 (+),score=93.69 TRINITY_DN30995_c0_g1_i1:92-1717(+)